jgi:hypothetical protein
MDEKRATWETQETPLGVSFKKIFPSSNSGRI